MEDARIFSNYVPNPVLEKKIQMKNGIKDNEAYRRFLVNNAERIRSENQIHSIQENVPMNFTPRMPGTNTPHVFDSIQDNVFPYGYETNAVKSKYLSRQELATTRINKYKYCNV